MTEQPLTFGEFLDFARGEIEQQVDHLIEVEADQRARAALLRDREQIVQRMLDKTEIANLRHRLAEAEMRLRPRLVE